MSTKPISFISLNSILFIFSFILILNSCKQEQSDDSPVDNDTDTLMPEWTKNITIYGANIKQYTPKGTINSFSNHIPRLKSMGIQVIQLSPFFLNTKSAYAISDYNSIDPSIGTKQDMINLIDKIHAYKMKVVFEWSTDFTSKSHSWYRDYPSYYLNDSLSTENSLSNQELIKAVSCSSIGILDLNNQVVQDSILGHLKYWVANHNVNGYAFNSINKNSLSETASNILSKIDSNLLIINQDKFNKNDNKSIQNYDWILYNSMNDVANSRRSFKSINDKLRSEKNESKINFITTHIENALNGSEIERLGNANLAFAVLIHTISGIPYMHNGQEEPMQKRLSFCKENKIGFKNFAAMRFHKDLIHLKNNNKALWNVPFGGKMEFLSDHDEILSFKRMKDDELVYVVINMSDQEQKLNTNVSIENVTDIFTKQKVDYKKGALIKLKPWQFIVAVK